MSSESIHISVVAPAYKCEACIELLYSSLCAELQDLTSSYEVVFVDDGSLQRDWQVIKNLCSKDTHVKGIKLCRNFGQHYAITAGLDYAQGEWVVVMDCDLQDRPEEIKKLYAKAIEGNPVVFAQRVQRQDPFFRKLASKVFSAVYHSLSGMSYDYRVANFSICSQDVVKQVCRLRERDRSFPMLVKNVGFHHEFIKVSHGARYSGKSSYTVTSLLTFALQTAVSHSNKPLLISIKIGLLLGAVSIFFAAFLVFRYYITGVPVEGWTSLAVLIGTLGGVGFLNLGILGLYIGKIFDEVKRRPLYHVEEKLNINT